MLPPLHIEGIALEALFLSEFIGTLTMMTLGVGVSANSTLAQTKGSGGGYLMSALGWSLGVYAGVYLANASGAHLNPAITLAKVLEGTGELAPGVPISAAMVLVYVVAQLLGAIVGASIAWLVYRAHFAATTVPGGTVTVFATSPGIRGRWQNLTTEIIATFFLVLVVLKIAEVPSGLGPLGVALLVLGIGLGLGGPTGWAINPARDLGARIAHAALPIAGKSDNDWHYSWIPIAGPLLGAAVAAMVTWVF